MPPETSEPVAEHTISADDDLAFARSVIAAEAATLENIPPLGDAFLGAVDALHQCQGHAIVTGMGKAGLIGAKIAATLASTGTPAFSMHPAEAFHGDLGMVSERDLIIVLSNSGASEEIVRILPHVKGRVPIIAITRDDQSPLGKTADHLLALGRIEEACPLGLAPSASTTAMLALGDALALTVQRRRGFTDEDFAKFHPGGSLGRKLQRVSEVMRTDDRLPLIHRESTVIEALERITKARAGLVIVTDAEQKLCGVFTDGDFRRHWMEDAEVGKKPVGEYMTSPCRAISELELVQSALRTMHGTRINQLPVVNADNVVVGLLDIQDVVA
jgi:arabinose-5-phosphate isomerase